MDSKPLVSILIPSFNQEDYIGDAIRSALAQDYSPLEVIVIDDSSTDNTFEIAQSYLTDSRLQVKKNPHNLGRVANYRYSMISIASGEWVLNLDGDDYLTDPLYISFCVDMLMRHQDVVFIQGKVTMNSNYVHTKHSPKLNIYTGKEYLINRYKVRTFNHMSTLYNRGYALKAGFYEKDILSSDAESMLRLCQYGNVILTDCVAGYWRPHGKNFTFTSDAFSKMENYETLINSIICQFEYKENFVSSGELNDWKNKMHIEYFVPIIVKSLPQGIKMTLTLLSNYRKLGGKLFANKHLYTYALNRIWELIKKFNR